MAALDAEYIGSRLTRGRELECAAVAEAVRRARCAVRRIGRVRNRIKAVGQGDRFRVDQLYRPAAKRRGAGIGDTHVRLKESITGAGTEG